MAACELVCDVVEIGEIYAFSRPTRAALDRVGRAHAGLADDGVNPLFVGVASDGTRRTLPVEIAKAEGI